MHGAVPLPLLRLDAVSLQVRGQTLIRNLSFGVQRGRRTILLGANGAGKTLTLRLCHGLLQPSSGRVLWTERDGAAPRHAMVFQRPVLLRRSALANVAHAAALAGLGFGDRRARAAEALDRFGLAHLANRSARSLSGGEQQRLAIARAWALRPDVLFLDEPTASLDPAATRAVEEMIETCHAEGVTILMTTHDLGQARRLGEDILFMHAGALNEAAPAPLFFDAPRSREAQAFLRGELLW